VYVTDFDHTAFTAVLPYFIKAYKAGSTDVTLDAETAVAWYRTTDKSVCGDGGTVWGQDGTASAASGTNDVISVISLSNTSPAPSITIAIGDSSVEVSPSATLGKASFYTTSFSGKTGAVKITANGKTATGTSITSTCPSSGHVNFNAVALQIS
jgi:glucan endo-1,3-alpha-glucosidase